jgi:uncharacterized protein (DUF1810 family)
VAIRDEWGRADDLDRFVEAQRPLYGQALSELRAGRKESHWMWFVFPQLRGLGRSPTSRLYGLASRQEAKDYLSHPLLGPRLRECIEAVNAVEGRSAVEIFGSIDAMKLRSSATLFRVAGGGPPFERCLERFFGGEPDDHTLALLGLAG